MARRHLLDTHVLLWWLAEPERLSAKVLAVLNDPGSDVLVSAASAWEIATKHRLGKLPTAAVLLGDYQGLLDRQGFRHLSISAAHGLRAGSYGQAHRDPFDRLLAAQGELEQLVLISADPALEPFPVQRLW
ncbi:type II toxin-antitoxin system VapC family toxin [Cyanobium sp. ATX 6F1]|uniref:type II toxin-antitoxin system VapC family toxin n=1 Tax=unclassified Cyanobium TaxID=2627006 RepID=UPI0020CCA476|nr:type II toxin-antitoxin system VapC family toxin [Cyanobium sp. ATX 6F1]MCP9915814.1 type II toxin-antitoxin system VapC family toxin [Cyanobium sp. ATX 6F1]